MSRVDYPKCDSCGQPMRWGETTTGGRMPCDPVPGPHGNVYLTASGKWRVLTEEERRRAEKAGVDLFSSHFETCPAAGRHRGVSRAQTSLFDA